MGLVNDLRAYLLANMLPRPDRSQVITQSITQVAVPAGVLPTTVVLQPMGGAGLESGDLVKKRVQVYCYGERYEEVRDTFEQVMRLLDAYVYTSERTEPGDVGLDLNNGIEKPGHGCDYYFLVEREKAA